LEKVVVSLVDISDRKELERQVVEAAADEQRRIGQDIHDGVGQELTGLRYMAQTHAESLAQQSSPDAQFFDPHVSVGQVVSIEAIGLIRKMPAEAVMRMAFVGRYERMTAQRAYDLGMISQIVDPPERLREEAQDLAEKIAKNSPAAMAATKRALWGALESGLTDACRAGAAELVSMWGHPDQAEGPRAFAEKREAEWKV
jgi:1,4-dihydroxy-2-naphthoyl-CoA synthase